MYEYKGRKLNLDETLQKIYDNKFWGGPVDNSTVECACATTPEDMTDEELTTAVNTYISDELEINGYLPPKEALKFGDYDGNLTDENLIKSDMSPEDEFEIKERLFGVHNSTEMIPAKEYPAPISEIFAKWRERFAARRVVGSLVHPLFAQISVIYRGCHYAVNPISMGTDTDTFYASIDEIKKELLDAGCAVRVETWQGQ